MKNLDFILYIKEYYNKSCVLDIELYKIQSELARVETGIPVNEDCLTHNLVFIKYLNEQQ